MDQQDNKLSKDEISNAILEHALSLGYTVCFDNEDKDENILYMLSHPLLDNDFPITLELIYTIEDGLDTSHPVSPLKEIMDILQYALNNKTVEEKVGQPGK